MGGGAWQMLVLVLDLMSPVASVALNSAPPSCSCLSTDSALKINSKSLV